MSYYIYIYIYIYIQRGRSQCLTMRHITGSSSIICIFYGLGHSVSHSAVLEHDTALANSGWVG